MSANPSRTAVQVGDHIIDASSNLDGDSVHEADLIVQKITYDGMAEIYHRAGPFAAYIPVHLIDGDGTRPQVRFHVKRDVKG